MHAPRFRIALFSTLIIAAVAGGLAVFAEPTSASIPRSMRVKLFEGGKQVGEWTTEGPARNEGNVLIFTTRQGVSSREVRIQGTYSAEAID